MLLDDAINQYAVWFDVRRVIRVSVRYDDP